MCSDFRRTFPPFDKAILTASVAATGNTEHGFVLDLMISISDNYARILIKLSPMQL